MYTASFASCSSNHIIDNFKSNSRGAKNLAQEAGRDGACAFRSLSATAGFKSASHQASRIILGQCPTGFLHEACQSFYSNVEQAAWAVCWKTELAIQAIEVISTD